MRSRGEVTDRNPLLDVPRGERTKRLQLAIISGLLTKPLALIAPLITVPLFLRYLGRERYGLYETVISIGGWLVVANVGLGYGLVNRLVDCHISGDRELARRYVWSVLVGAGAICAVGLFLCTAIVPLIPWGHVFHLNDQRAASELPWAAWIACAATLVGLVVSTPGAVYIAYQESHRNSLWDAAARLSAVGASVLVVFTPLGLVGVTMAVCLTPIIVRALNGWVMVYVEKPWLRPQGRAVDRHLFRTVAIDGVGLCVLQLCTLGIFQADKVIISAVVGPLGTADYAVVGRVFLAALGVVQIINGPLWAAHGEAIRRGDLPWVRRALAMSLGVGALCIVATGAALAVFKDSVLYVWAGSHITAPVGLIFAMTAVFVIWTSVSSLSLVLNSKGVVWPQVYFLGAHALLSVIAGIALVQKWGVVGVAWAIVFTALPTTLWGYPWLVHRYMGRWQRRTEAAVA